jgi:hypothetical protein
MASADQVLLTINHKPRAVAEKMDELMAQSKNVAQRSSRRAFLPVLFLIAGAPFVCFDLALGYGAFYFTCVTAGLWIAAFVTFVAWWRARPGTKFPPHYATARQVIFTLRDDLRPKENLLGKLDLTGARQPSKLARTGTGIHDAKMNYYRDEWLSLKAKLYDGNLLRVSAIERVKVKEGMFRRGSSGKMKWRPEKIENGQQLKVRLAVNPQAYETLRVHNVQLSTQIGQYFVDGFTANDGIIELSAGSTAKVIKPEDILGVLKFAYDQLERKGQQ